MFVSCAFRTDVEHEAHNTTRFVVLSPDFVQASVRERPGGDQFHLQRPEPSAALFKALGGFATNGVNLARALEELAFLTTDVKIMGVYPADEFRSSTATQTG